MPEDEGGALQRLPRCQVHTRELPVLRYGATMKLSRLFLAGLVCLSCAKKQAPPPPPLAVEVATVIQKDVPITKEWIGSLEGYVNADIRPQVTGYLMRQVYKEGSFVRRSDVLFEIGRRGADSSTRPGSSRTCSTTGFRRSSDVTTSTPSSTGCSRPRSS